MATGMSSLTANLKDIFFSIYSVMRHCRTADYAAATNVIGQQLFSVHAILHWGLASTKVAHVGCHSFQTDSLPRVGLFPILTSTGLGRLLP